MDALRCLLFIWILFAIVTNIAVACVNTYEVFTRLQGLATFEYSIKGQIEGDATFTFSGPLGLLGQFSYNTNGNYLNSQSVRNVKIEADWNGNVQITKSNMSETEIGLYVLSKLGRKSSLCSFLYILAMPMKPVIVPDYTTVGKNATLLCNSSSTTTPSNHSLGLIYSWLVNNRTFTSRQFYFESGKHLMITNLTESDAKLNYSCIATENITDGYRSEISDEISLNIAYGPDENTTKLVPPISMYTINEGVAFDNISCVGICFPMCIYKWVKQEQNKSALVSNYTDVLSLGVIDRANAATYICTVLNPESNKYITKEVNVLVRYGPDENTTTLYPIDTYYKQLEGMSLINIYCNSNCYPTCLYNWTRVTDDRVIGTSSVLSLAKLTRDMADTYVCTVTNPEKEGQVSRELNISVIYGPDDNGTYFSPPSTTYTVNVDTVINDIACISDCFPYCEYIWTTTNEGNEVQIIENKTGVLSRRALNETTALTYTCFVSNPESNKTVTKEIVIYVRYGPDENTTFLSPSTKSYSVDESVFLDVINCSGQCYPPCLYTWTRVVLGKRETVSKTGLLSLGNVNRSDASVYVCTVSNADISNIVTRVITVNVRYGPDVPIINVPSPFIVNEGQKPGEIICSSDCYPACLNTWTNMTSGLDIGYIGTFTFGIINRFHAAEYRCTSRNIETKNRMKTTLRAIVRHAPDVSIRVSTSNFTEGSNVTLFCEATGVPSNYTYKAFTQLWEEVEILNTHTALPGMPMYSSIYIPSLQLRDSGTYVCTVNNGITAINGILNQNASTMIDVKVRPKVLKEDLIFFGSLNGLVKVVIPVYSYLKFEMINFKRNGNTTLAFYEMYNVSFRDANHSVTFYDKRVMLEAKEFEMYLMDVTEEDLGNYTLVLGNDIGQTTVTFSVLLKGRPYSPKRFFVRWNTETASLLWEKNQNGGHEQSFIIQIKVTSELKWKTYISVNENDSMHKFNDSFYIADVINLKPGAYLVRIRARNILGDSDPVYLNATLEISKIERKQEGGKDGISTTTTTVLSTQTIVIIATSSGTLLLATILISVICKRRMKRRSQNPEVRKECSHFENQKGNEYEEPVSYAIVQKGVNKVKITDARKEYSTIKSEAENVYEEPAACTSAKSSKAAEATNIDERKSNLTYNGLKEMEYEEPISVASAKQKPKEAMATTMTYANELYANVGFKEIPDSESFQYQTLD